MHYHPILRLSKEVLSHSKADHAPDVANVEIALLRNFCKRSALAPFQGIANLVYVYEMQRHHASTSLCSIHDIADRSAEKVVQFMRCFSSILPCIFDLWW
jgi:hypothetical protein